MSFDIFSFNVSVRGSRNRSRGKCSIRFSARDTHPHLREKDPGYVVVEYPDGSGGSIYTGCDEDDPLHSSNMMFNHCGGESFWRDLYELADRIDGAAAW
jgi:hypothetical protein